MSKSKMLDPNLYQDHTESERAQVFMFFMAILVGTIAGFGAVVFRGMIAFFHNLFFLGKLSVHYIATAHTAPSPWSWGIVFVPVIGAIIVAWLVKTFAPEAKGHGVPEVIYAIYHKSGFIRPVVAVVKSLASSLSIGTGGSIGREGPIIQIGAAFGSALGTWVKMPDRQRVVLIAAGAGGGIAATFNAPLGGFAFAIELMMVSVSPKALMPVALATGIATYIGQYFFGVHASFFVPNMFLPAKHLADFWPLCFFIPFGVIMGFVGLLFIKAIYKFEDIFDGMPGNYYTRHMLGMLIVGIMFYLFMKFTGYYYIQGVGYATIVDVISNVILDPWFLLLLFATKLLATCLTLGSGASGGIFSPSLYMGATLGYFLGIIVKIFFPESFLGPVDFAVVGMACMVASTTGAIVCGTIIVLEMTQDYKVVLPMLIAAGLALAIRKYYSNSSIYTMKLLRRGFLVPEGLQSSLIVQEHAENIMVSLASVRNKKIDNLKVKHDKLGEVSEVIFHQKEVKFIQVVSSMPVIELLRLMQRKGVDVALVVEQVGDKREIKGVVTPKQFLSYQQGMAKLMDA